MQNPGSDAGVFCLRVYGLSLIAIKAPANAITAATKVVPTAIRLGGYFRTDPRFWLNLQAAYDLSKAEKAHSYKKIVPRTAA
jgi:plasmid maintenance system antidote protein VapI